MVAITFHDTLLKMKKDGGKSGKWIDTSRNKMKNDDNSEDFYFVTVTCSSMFLCDLLVEGCALITPIQILKNESLVCLQCSFVCSTIQVSCDIFHVFPQLPQGQQIQKHDL